MKPLLIKNGRVVDPASKLDARRDILLEDGRLAAVEAKIERAGAEVFDAANLVVAPGFIDMHVHLREPGKESAETIQSGARAAAAGGFTAVACMPNTQPANDTALVTRYILAQAAQAGGARVYPIGAVTKNLAGEELAELESLRAAGAVAFSDDGHPVWNSRILRRALEYAAALNLAVIDHCEDPQLAAGGVMHEGDCALRLGLRGIPALAEELPVTRNVVMAALAGGHIHLAHLSTRGALEVVRRAKRAGVRVTCEVTPHHFTLTDEACREYDTRAKMNPPLRTADDVTALVEGLADGTVDAIASDHAPHTPTEKQADFESAPFGVIGLETAVALALDKLFHASKITLPRLVELFSANPARILGVEGGQLKVGAPADLTVLDLERKWTYRAAEGVSKSRNSPFDGWSFRGAAAATIVAGVLVFRR
ncbi:MAG: dihydroorotase [Acidobacteria bacterium RIFCSPHIGHO2_01_FULL_67_28]|nr:MAG: dihydroorotase [Acidobacteria bacterium RIFCSPHIGHO2_01_FULL_67_28]